MEPLTSFKVPGNAKVASDDDEVEGYEHRMNEVSHQVYKLEQRIQEIEQYYSSNRKKQHNSLRDKDKGRHATGSLNQRDDNKAAFNRMQDLITQFRTILNQITQRKGACPSLDSVDVDDLGLHDSSEVIGKPRDLNSIKKRMEAKDDSAYKNVREIYADVRWVLKNAMNCNDERSDAHVTAKTMLAKFEEKWLLLLPKVMQEDRTGEGEDSKQAYHAQMAKDVSSELYKVEFYLNKLREQVLQRCRRMSTLEKRDLGKVLTKLSADDLTKALAIVAEGNPAFQAAGEEVDLDIDAQSESTLWRLKYFIVEILRAQGNQTTSIDDDKKDENNDNAPANTSKPGKSNLKRKRHSRYPRQNSQERDQKDLLNCVN